MKWSFAKNGVYDKSNEKGKEIRIYNDEKNRNVKNDVVCSSSFKYKNTTTTYSAKNGVFKNEGVETIENTDIRENAKNGKNENERSINKDETCKNMTVANNGKNEKYFQEN